MPPTTSPTPVPSSRWPTTSASPPTSATVTCTTARSGLEELVDRHRGETVVVVRGGDDTDPSCCSSTRTGVTRQPIEGLS